MSEKIHSYESILKVVRESIVEIAEGGDYSHVSMDSRISSLGLDSLAISEVAASVEDRLGVFLPNEKLFTSETLGDVVTELHALATPGGARD